MKLFITGTDTGVGKTTVTVALAQLARARDLSVFAFKPIETGGTEDQEALSLAAGDWQVGPQRNLYTFKLPIAPLVAARAEGRSIDLELISQTVSRETSDVVLVEGAGGWRVPIAPTADMSTLARCLGFPILVVARAGLGTLNHSLLTLEAIQADGCIPAAVVLSHRPADSLELTASNAAELRRLVSCPVLIFDLTNRSSLLQLFP